MLADEVLTPDSSRYWDAATWQPGPAAAVLRQAVRARLAHVAGVGLGPHSDTPPPPLPDHVVEQTRAKYVEAYERLTGEVFA